MSMKLPKRLRSKRKSRVLFLPHSLFANVMEFSLNIRFGKCGNVAKEISVLCSSFMLLHIYFKFTSLELLLTWYCSIINLE